MATITMPTTMERAQSKPSRGVSQVMPLLLAIVLLVVTGVGSMLISGPMH